MAIESIPAPEKSKEKINSIESSTIAGIKEHIGEIFTSENVFISGRRLKTFLKATEDINPIHFDEDMAKESVLFKEGTEGEVVSGDLISSLCANKDVLYKALIIKEPHEVIQTEKTTKFTAPVFTGSSVVYEYKLESAEELTLKSRAGMKVNWGIEAYVVSGDGVKEKRPCMKAVWTLWYGPVPNKSESEKPESRFRELGDALMEYFANKSPDLLP